VFEQGKGIHEKKGRNRKRTSMRKKRKGIM
jgi:hypothetical protein